MASQKDDAKTKPNDIIIALQKAQAREQMEKSTSLFGDSHHQLKFGKALRKVTIDDLREEDISDMLSAQKDFERFRFCKCNACYCLLSAMWKIRLLLLNIICCGTLLLVSYYIIENKYASDHIFYYTLYFFFLILAISITKFIFLKAIMLILTNVTKNTWNVFYVKNIRNRLYLCLLSTLWAVGFYFFDSIIAQYGYNDYHPNIYKFLLCIYVSSLMFLATHILIRYAALYSYFEIFKVRTRKLKTFITMIELMSGKKNLFSMPLMNFLIDFPSAADHKNAKKHLKSSVHFKVIQETEEDAQEIAEAIRSKLFDLETIENVEEELITNAEINVKKYEQTQRASRVQFAVINPENALEDEKGESLSEWLQDEKLASVNNNNAKKVLNALNIASMQDLEEILVDLYQSNYAHEFRETFVNKEWMKQLEKDMLAQGMTYSEWCKFRSKTYDHFVPKIKLLIEAEKEQQVKSKARHAKRASTKFFTMRKNISVSTGEISEKDEILNLNHSLYSVRLTGSSETVHVLSDKDLNKLTKILSYLIMIRLNQQKQKVLTQADLQRKQSKEPQAPKLGTSKGKQNLFAQRSLLGSQDYIDNQRINKELFIKIFQSQTGNSDLLQNMGEFAWKKFGPQNNDEIDVDDLDFHVNDNDLDVMYLNGHIVNVFNDLLLLKKTIDSYTIIITNVQRMVDVCTPLLLLFVYLYIFNFSFADTLGLYISVVGVIAFFGQSYFSSVFSSISFVLALNPFLVGDYIMYDNQVYLVIEISLISCTFKWLKTGSLYTFQNEQLSKSKLPIVNLSRSELTKTKYRWTVYMRHDVSYEDLERYKKRVKELVMQNKITKNENFRSIKVRADDGMEGWTKIKVKIQMKYDRYSSDVNAVGFICCSKAMSEMNLYWRPLPITIHLKTK